MRLLILGGTAWLGEHIAATATARGNEVTCLARGSSGSAPTGATLVQADRTRADAYDDVIDGRWDAVVDVSRQPGQVRTAVTALAGHTDLYVLVSSSNVYADHSGAGRAEDDALVAPLPGDVMESMEFYGPAKVACEQHVLTAFGQDRTLIARAGLLGGPGDTFDRSGYWPVRFARPAEPDGSVLAPDAPAVMTRLLDYRDLADWLLAAATQQTTGTFNATGDPFTLRQHLEIARQVAGHTGEVVWADSDWLDAAGVQQWAGPRSLPMWLNDPGWLGFNNRDSTRARDAGLAVRPLAQTLADTLEWELTRTPPDIRSAGLSDQDERKLLAEWAARTP